MGEVQIAKSVHRLAGGRETRDPAPLKKAMAKTKPPSDFVSGRIENREAPRLTATDERPAVAQIERCDPIGDRATSADLRAVNHAVLIATKRGDFRESKRRTDVMTFPRLD